MLGSCVLVEEGLPLVIRCRSSTANPRLMRHGVIRFRGAEGGSLRTLDSDDEVTSASNTLAGRDTGGSPTTRRRILSGEDRGLSSGRGTSSSGLSFVLKNKRHAARAFRKLTDEQVQYVIIAIISRSPTCSSDEISSWFSSRVHGKNLFLNYYTASSRSP